MKDLRFQWHDEKRRANIRKHGVTFEEASTVFLDYNARIKRDPDHSIDEDRFLIVGISRKFRILLVSYCYRQNHEVIRIISARMATSAEVKNYGRRFRG